MNKWGLFCVGVVGTCDLIYRRVGGACGKSNL